MLTLVRKIAGAALVLGVLAALSACSGGFVKMGPGKETAPLSAAAISRIKSIGSTPGAPMMVRIFKQSSELEVWKQSSAGDYRLLKTYEICSWSGDLGPKIKEGDRQSPEGFYTITPGLMNPRSSYYLAFNTGFPNKFDRSYGRTGSDLMVHGDCSSRGCYAMTDEGIAEIYALARETFKGGNRSFQLEIYPFRMTAENLAKQSKSPHLDFWNNIKEGYDRFDIAKRPATWDACGRQYVFEKAASGQAMDATAACPTLNRDETMMAALAKRRAADQATFATQVASVEKRETDAIKAAERAAASTAAAKERGQAINGAMTGFFGGIGNMFGGEERVDKVMNPTLVAPLPAARIARS